MLHFLEEQGLKIELEKTKKKGKEKKSQNNILPVKTRPPGCLQSVSPLITALLCVISLYMITMIAARCFHMGYGEFSPSIVLQSK